MKIFWILLIVMGLLYWNEDPLKALNKGGPSSLTLLEENSYLVSDGTEERRFTDYIFDAKPYGKLYFTISLPVNAKEKLPCVVVIDGLDTGRKSLELIPDHNNYALIAFEYPPELRLIKGYSVLRHLLTVRRSALNVPGQISSIVDWVQKQSWFNGEAPCLMGFSFGTQFIPAIYHLAEKQKISLGPGVLAFGGAGLFRLFYSIPGNIFIKLIRGCIGQFLFLPLEPQRHLPYVHGEFLVMNGVYDELIPFSAALKLQKLVPEPKTVINLEVPHLQPKNDPLLQELIAIARRWLSEKRKEKGTLSKVS